MAITVEIFDLQHTIYIAGVVSNTKVVFKVSTDIYQNIIFQRFY